MAFEAEVISWWNCWSFPQRSAESRNNFGYSASNACLIWDDSAMFTYKKTNNSSYANSGVHYKTRIAPLAARLNSCVSISVTKVQKRWTRWVLRFWFSSSRKQTCVTGSRFLANTFCRCCTWWWMNRLLCNINVYQIYKEIKKNELGRSRWKFDPSVSPCWTKEQCGTQGYFPWRAWLLFQALWTWFRRRDWHYRRNCWFAKVVPHLMPALSHCEASLARFPGQIPQLIEVCPNYGIPEEQFQPGENKNQSCFSVNSFNVL